MTNTMGIILTGGNSNKLQELSNVRSSSAIPMGGKYRAIDFVLSNMVNSGIVSVGVLTQFNIRSLMDHLGSGKEWDLDRRTKGLFILPPYLSPEGNGWYRGSADAIFNNMSFLRRSDEEYVLIAQGNCIYKMDYTSMLDQHLETGADITLAYREMIDYQVRDLSTLGIINLDAEGRVTDFQEKPFTPPTINGSMGVYILKKDLLIDLIEESVSHGNYDFVKDILIKKVHKLKIYGYKFDGYWRNLSSIELYYKTNMDFLDHKIRYELFVNNGKIYTKIMDQTPAKYNHEADVTNSIVADGCIIEGNVQNSVLFRGVIVKKGAVVKNSIVMQGTVLEENAILVNAIVDKNATISAGKSLKGEDTWPIIVAKRVVV